jgi:hypothetical protein
VLHGHEQRVEHDAYGDGQVHEGVHDDEVDDLLDLQPSGGALPDQEGVRKLIPAGRTTSLGLLQFWRQQRTDSHVNKQRPPTAAGKKHTPGKMKT